MKTIFMKGRNIIRKNEITMNKKIQKILATTLSVFFVFSSDAHAYTIRNVAGTSSQGSFVVGPAKSELSLNPGETKTIELRIQNRMGRTQSFVISFENFVASNELDQAVVLAGAEMDTQTSLAQYIRVEKNNFTLEQGDELLLPVTISIPEQVAPGGKFGAVVVSAVSLSENSGTEERAYSGASVVSRIASLMFVRVNGDIVTSGTLVDFSTRNNQAVFWSGDIPVRMLFENTGTVHINPYGIISVKDIFGDRVGEAQIDPWFVLPGSVRTRDVSLRKEGLLGRYTATLEINPGYGSTTQMKEVAFYVVSPIALFVTIIISAVTVFGTRIVFKKRKEQKLV